MPGLDGFDFLKAYQDRPATQREARTVIMLTTSQDARDIARLCELPAASLLTKPLTKEKMPMLLAKHFA